MWEHWLKRTMAGEDRDPVRQAARVALHGASLLYGRAIAYRNRHFDGQRSVHQASVPVISIGNLTAGGTGKTPLVAEVCQTLCELGMHPAILSRGYRSLGDSSNRQYGGLGNDEARVLDLLCKGIPHLQSPDRVASAARAVGVNGADILVLDDGFQHRRLARDFDIVLIDATNPFGFDYLLPRGLLREPIESLRRAHFVIITRADLTTESELAEIEARIRSIRSDLPVCRVSFPVRRVIDCDGTAIPLSKLGSQKLFAFSGIGNPAAFRTTLNAAGLAVSGSRDFADHHHYTPDELEQIANLAAQMESAAVVTTLKDLVKIPHRQLRCTNGHSLPLWAVDIGVRLDDGGSKLRQELRRFTSQTAAAAA